MIEQNQELICILNILLNNNIMPYKVLNQEGEVIIIDSIDPSIHKHLSWRDFDEGDECVKVKKEEKVVEEITEELTDISVDELREQYKEKFWKYPSSKIRLENIKAKLK